MEASDAPQQLSGVFNVLLSPFLISSLEAFCS